MKLFSSKHFWVISTIVLFVGYFVSCKHEIIVRPSSPNNNELKSIKTSTPPNIDGNIDEVWNAVPKLVNETEVPNPGNDLFKGYIGDKYQFSLKSMYDNNYIYFLAEWNDKSKGTSVQPWYFNPITKRWAQESNSRILDSLGTILREGIGTDQLAFLWNIDNSTNRFTAQTCYASCHIFTPYTNAQGVEIPNKNGNHYTNGPEEKIDMWWLRINKELPLNQMDDQYQDWAGGPSITGLVGGNGNGRHADDLIPASTFSTSYINTNSNSSNGPINNRISLKLDGTGASVNVPAWVVPNALGLPYINATDTLPGGSAKKVTGISSTGILSYTGGFIDPNGQTEYHQIIGISGVGAKCIPSFITAPYTLGRSDFTAKGVHTGSGWIVEFKRALNTNSTLKQDINFASLQDQPFGIAIFNNCNYQHSIKPNLLLKFQK